MFERFNEYNKKKDHKIGTHEMVVHGESVANCHKKQQICHAAVNNYPLSLKFVSYCYITLTNPSK